MLASLSKATLDEAINEAEHQLAPFSLDELAAAVEKLLRFARTYNITTDRTGLVETYRDGCRGMSRRALREGVEMVLRNWSDNFRLPQPGAVWDIVRDETARWEAELRALENVRDRMGRPDLPALPDSDDVPVSPEYVQETQEITKRMIAALEAKSREIKIL